MRRTGLWLAALCVSCLLAVGCGDKSGEGGADGGGNDNENETPITCGNGEVEGVEECDEGSGNSDTEPDTCRTRGLVSRVRGPD